MRARDVLYGSEVTRRRVRELGLDRHVKKLHLLLQKVDVGMRRRDEFERIVDIQAACNALSLGWLCYSKDSAPAEQ
jgi:hypothetical protein